VSSGRSAAGFTLVEVLIAMAITVFVGMVAYSSISGVLVGADVLQRGAERSYEINRAWMIISRDLRQFVARPVRDEFGQIEPALLGGDIARFPLSFTRTGWHNPAGQPRSNLQRVNYRLQDEALWRDSYFVLDRAGDTEPRSALLLDGVESLELLFLGALGEARLQPGSTEIDMRNWADNWVPEASLVDPALPPPVALEIRLQLVDEGEMRRLYVLPPL